MSRPISFTLREVYEYLCKKCRNKIRELVKERITDQLIEQAIFGAGPDVGRSHKKR